MIDRSKALDMLAADGRFAQVTAGQALARMSVSMRMALQFEDRAFFIEHAADPCHEVARACRADRVWHGDESYKSVS